VHFSNDSSGFNSKVSHDANEDDKKFELDFLSPGTDNPIPRSDFRALPSSLRANASTGLCWTSRQQFHDA
jgi:hypothetical protein